MPKTLSRLPSGATYTRIEREAEQLATQLKDIRLEALLERPFKKYQHPAQAALFALEVQKRLDPDQSETFMEILREQVAALPSWEWRPVRNRASVALGRYSVQLTHAANPDIRHDGYWGDIPPRGKKVVWVNSLAEASQACRNFIAEWGLGGGNWTGGLVKKDGKPFAQISYNGRAWEAGKDFCAALEIDLSTEQVLPRAPKL